MREIAHSKEEKSGADQRKSDVLTKPRIRGKVDGEGGRMRKEEEERDSDIQGR